ncbi:DUF5025 domain-containing protein [Pedobacter nutrimenti]|uniref:Uncharacterized protein DUF5025 n=1 Tax=Pedobacter nutrimenti TaxID=1241337 RepID=A0A318UL79_9SPHI|nr:DUF5025 domain-containing protein [Pedobacter nutrimenti]PYF77124.1 uncharacterized protein DUF5025 [Pedobacter nutrimenti]
MKSLLLSMFIIFTICACKKEHPIPKPPPEKEYVQYFKGFISEKPLLVTQSGISGDWTGLSSVSAPDMEVYRVIVNLQETYAGRLQTSFLRFQLFNMKNRTFKISGHEPILDLRNSYIFLNKKLGPNDEDAKFYTPNNLKKPFEINITRYEYLKNSGLPYVKGTLNGVLYNIKDITDSIVIRDGDFDVHNL